MTMARPVMLKDAIYQSALSLFGQHGLTETSIRDIARHAGVSEGSMYRHWPSKLALGWDIFKTNLEELAKEIRSRLAIATEPEQQVRAIIAAFYELFDSDRNLFRFILLNQHELWPRLGEANDDPVRLWDQFVHTHWTGKRAEGVSPKLIMSMTLGMILQPAILAVYGSIGTPLSEQVDHVARHVCGVLGLGSIRRRVVVRLPVENPANQLHE